MVGIYIWSGLLLQVKLSETIVWHISHVRKNRNKQSSHAEYHCNVTGLQDKGK